MDKTDPQASVVFSGSSLKSCEAGAKTLIYCLDALNSGVCVLLRYGCQSPTLRQKVTSLSQLEDESIILQHFQIRAVSQPVSAII